MKICIIGTGFVGGSLEKFYRLWNEDDLLWNGDTNNNDVFAWDISDDTFESESEAYVAMREFNPDIVYVCVPTPMNSDGECHTGLVEGVLRELSDLAFDSKILIKSTMVPGTTDRLQGKFENLNLITNPEFLTERNALNDMINAKSHLFGVREGIDVDDLIELHKRCWPDAELVFVKPLEAELVKYLTNTYFSVKVSFANHIESLVNVLGIDYGQWIKKAISVDPRIEPTHWDVPGPDGFKGFGGKCFPKDLNGMISLFKQNNVPCPLLETAWSYNEEIREDKDWLKIKGATI